MNSCKNCGSPTDRANKICASCQPTSYEKGPRTVDSDSLLLTLAQVLLWFGIIGGGILVGLSGLVNNTSQFDFYAENGFDIPMLITGIGGIFSGVFWYAVLKGLSDIVYLLKSKTEPKGD